MSVSVLSLKPLSDAPLESSRQCQIPRSLQKQKKDRRGHVIIGFLILHMFVTSTFLNHVSASSLKFITMEIEVFFGRTFDDDGEAASALKILLISTQRPTTSASARPSGA